MLTKRENFKTLTLNPCGASLAVEILIKLKLNLKLSKMAIQQSRPSAAPSTKIPMQGAALQERK